MSDTIRYSVDSDGIATLTIDLPGQSMNVFTEEMLERLGALVEKVASDAAVKGAIVTSGKPTFLAGADLKMIQALIGTARSASVPEILKRAARPNEIFRRLETCGKPFAAAVGGLAMGGGLELALACHYRLVANDPKIQLGLPEVKVGLMPGAGGTQRLPRLMGIQMSAPYLLQGKSMSPQEAVGFKVFHKAVEPSSLLAEAKAMLLDDPDAAQPWDKKGFKVPGGAGGMNPAAVQVFMAGNAMIQKETWRNYPAAIAILSSVYEGTQIPMDKALGVESRYFTSLLVDPTAGNMIRTLFVNKGAADKLVRRPKDVEKAPVRKLGVLGAGMMGAGIAHVSAAAGIDVVLLDRELAYAEKGKAHAEAELKKRVAKRRMSEDAAKAVLARIQPSADYAALKDCDLIVEAVFEDAGIKADVTHKTEAVIAKSAIFATNTSTMPITGLAKASKRPNQFVGIHFFSPVEKMPLVEIIVGKKTGDGALAKALDYVQQIKKTPIVVNDGRGFYTSRVVTVFVNEGLYLLAEGVKPALIENAARMAGMPVGPLSLADEVSIELSHHIKEAAKKALGDKFQQDASGDVLDLFAVKLKRLGRKNGKGFYDYPEGGKKRLWPGLAEHFPPAPNQPSVDDVKKRILYRQAVETARCIDEGILTHPADGDIGAIFGWGYAPFTGGPLSMIDTVGAAAFVKDCDALSRKCGPRFKAPKSLREMAKADGSYYGGRAA